MEVKSMVFVLHKPYSTAIFRHIDESLQFFAIPISLYFHHNSSIFSFAIIVFDDLVIVLNYQLPGNHQNDLIDWTVTVKHATKL